MPTAERRRDRGSGPFSGRWIRPCRRPPARTASPPSALPTLLPPGDPGPDPSSGVSVNTV